MVSDSSSFLRLMRSLSVSASRRACWIRACMASGDTSLAPWEFIVTVAWHQGTDGKTGATTHGTTRDERGPRRTSRSGRRREKEEAEPRG